MQISTGYEFHSLSIGRGIRPGRNKRGMSNFEKVAAMPKSLAVLLPPFQVINSSQDAELIFINSFILLAN